jgi:hypothetical protein
MTSSRVAGQALTPLKFSISVTLTPTRASTGIHSIATSPFIDFTWQRKSVSRSATSIAIQVAYTEYGLPTVFIIITLHRPWLLRKLKSNKFALSRRACFDAAKMDFRIVSLVRYIYSTSIISVSSPLRTICRGESSVPITLGSRTPTWEDSTESL